VATTDLNKERYMMDSEEGVQVKDNGIVYDILRLYPQDQEPKQEPPPEPPRRTKRTFKSLVGFQYTPPPQTTAPPEERPAPPPPPEKPVAAPVVEVVEYEDEDLELEHDDTDDTEEQVILAPVVAHTAPRRRRPSVLGELAMLVVKIVVILALVVAIFTFVYGVHMVSDPHMSPMINDGDVVMFFRMGRDYDIGDLLLLNYSGYRQVRRVVAQAGDTVDFAENGLIVNGALIHEPLIFQDTWRLETAVEFPLTVGSGQVFVLGDARTSAIDSRAYGPVNVSDTLGTVITVIRRRGM